MAVKKQKRVTKAPMEEPTGEKLAESPIAQVQGDIEQPTVAVVAATSEPKVQAHQTAEASALACILDDLGRVREQNERILATVSPISERLNGLEHRLDRQEQLQASGPDLDQGAILKNLKTDLTELFDVKRSGDYLELSSKTERLLAELEDLQNQLKVQYEKNAALRLEMEEERESATRLLQAARQREKALEQNVYQLNIREEELEELAVLNEELDARMVSQSEEFAKRTGLYEEEIFALKTAESNYQTKIAELESKLKSS